MSVKLCSDEYSGCCVANVTGDLSQPMSIKKYNLIFDVILLGIILLAGIVGNLLSIFVLTRVRTKGTTNLILRSLAICDTAFLVMCFFFQFMHTLCIYLVWLPYFNFHSYLMYVLYGSGMFIRAMRNWTVVLISIERWLVICWPFHAPQYCTKRRVRIAIVSITVICMLFSAPQYMIIEVSETIFQMDCSQPQASPLSETDYILHQSVTSPSAILTTATNLMSTSLVSFKQNPIKRNITIANVGIRPWVRQYKWFKLAYRVIGYNVFVIFIPLIILCVLNSLLIAGVRRASKQRSAMCMTAKINATSSSRQHKLKFVSDNSEFSVSSLVQNGNDNELSSSILNNSRPRKSMHISNCCFLIRKSNDNSTRKMKEPPRQSSSSTTASSSAAQSAEVNRICLGVIAVYIICEIPAIIYQVISYLRLDIKTTIRPICNLMVSLNSAVNFYMYVFLGKRFRRHLISLVCPSRVAGNTKMQISTYSYKQTNHTITQKAGDHNMAGYDSPVLNESRFNHTKQRHPTSKLAADNLHSQLPGQTLHNKTAAAPYVINAAAAPKSSLRYTSTTPKLDPNTCHADEDEDEITHL